MGEEDDAADRPSIMEHNGGLITGPPPRDPEDEQLATFDRGNEHHRLTSGKQFRGHPTLQCPNPRYSSSFRGFYHCPGCGKKVRLDGDPGILAAAQEDADRFLWALGWAIGECWAILWESVKALARAGRRACRALQRDQAPELAEECEHCHQQERAEVAEQDATLRLEVEI
jgi:hypothetical protein